MVNRTTKQSFTGTTDAKTWLNNNGYWTSWTTTAPAGYNIGDLAKGGIIAYILQNGDTGYDPNIQHGLAVTVSQPNSTDFSTAETNSNNTTDGGYNNLLTTSIGQIAASHTQTQ